VQCLGLTGACAACSHCTATAWELSDLDHSHAATPQRVTRASCAQLLLLRSDFCAWRRLLLICWKLLIGVCVYETGLLLLFAYIALLLLPLSFVLGVGAPSLSLVGFIFVIEAVRRGSLSFSWFVVASAACVYETGLLLVCACRTSAASVEPLPRGSRAVAFPLWLQVLSCSTWLIVRCSLLHQLFLLCFGFIGANSNSMNSISRAASSGR
jgi:hypothetical protein